jgi:hypothetical protein
MMKERNTYLGLCALAVLSAAVLSIPVPAQAQPISHELDVNCLKQNKLTADQALVGLDEVTRSVFIKTPCGWQYIRRATPLEVAAIKELSSPIEVPPEVIARVLNDVKQMPMIPMASAAQP